MHGESIYLCMRACGGVTVGGEPTHLTSCSLHALQCTMCIHSSTTTTTRQVDRQVDGWNISLCILLSVGRQARCRENRYTHSCLVVFYLFTFVDTKWHQWRQPKVSSNISAAGDTNTLAIIWILQNERNKRIFQNCFCGSPLIIQYISYYVNTGLHIYIYIYITYVLISYILIKYTKMMHCCKKRKYCYYLLDRISL